MEIFMNTKLYVGNLPGGISRDELETLFTQQGAVTEIKILRDQSGGQVRGYAFVTMATMESAHDAIFALNGREMHGRTLTVNKARSGNESETRTSGDRRDYRRESRRRY